MHGPNGMLGELPGYTELIPEVPVAVHCTVTVELEVNALGAAECMSDAQPESNTPVVSMQAHFQSRVIWSSLCEWWACTVRQLVALIELFISWIK